MNETLAEVTQAAARRMDEIVAMFKPGVKITLLVRTPGFPERDFCMTDDDLAEAREALRRRSLVSTGGKAMTLESAKEIVAAICQRSFAAMGLLDTAATSLKGVTLAEMLEAVGLVEVENERAQEHARQHGGGHHILVVPDARLTAAVYALENYEPGMADENVLVACSPVVDEAGRKGMKAVVVTRSTSRQGRGTVQ